MAYLEVRQLRKVFTTPNGDDVVALDDVSFAIEEGEILSVVGHNGSGKTTLFNCLRRTFPSDGGEMRLNGFPLGQKDTRVVSVYQEVSAGVVPSMTPRENLSLIFSRDPRFCWSIPVTHYQRKIDNLLAGLPWADRLRNFQDTPVAELSGGQRQQLAIAMALLREPELLLLDEFVANLDREIRTDVLEWIRDWSRENKVTTLIVTHDDTVARTIGDRILELQDGKVLRFEPLPQ